MIDRKIMIEAERGDKQAMFELGSYYLSENCFRLAFFWTKKAAELGQVEAMNLLGKLYRLGIGTQINLKKSFKWYSKASKKQNREAMLSLAAACFDGDVIMNGKKTLTLCKKAADADNAIGQYYLGLCYYKGIGVVKNLEKARYYFTMSSVYGFSFAKEQLNDKSFSIVV